MANRESQIDVALFTLFVDAYARDETKLARFHRRRFRRTSGRRSRIGSRPSPGRIPQRLCRRSQWRSTGSRPPRRPIASSCQAAASSEDVKRYIHRADNYSLTVVLFAGSLFSGISTRLRSRPARIIVLGLGYLLFNGSLVFIATFPVSVTV